MRKTFPTRLKKYPLHTVASPHMLSSNGDKIPIGGVCLIWWGYCAVCCTLGEELRMGVKMKKDGTIADSIP